MSTEQQNSAWDPISAIIGWIYFSAWTISFYGQIYENFKLKRAEGIKFDYVYLNLTGFIFYSIALSAGYFGGSKEDVGTVQIQDLLFAYHGAVMSLVQLIQMYIYPTGDNILSRKTKIFLAAYWTVLIVYLSMTKILNTFSPPSSINVWNLLGYFKVGITIKKYVFQCVYNMKRRSTEGWSIFNVLCDFTGGLFSFLQTFIDCTFRDATIVVPKLILGIFTIIFDLVFIFQHYVIYKVQTITLDTKPLFQTQELALENNNLNENDYEQPMQFDSIFGSKNNSKQEQS